MNENFLKRYCHDVRIANTTKNESMNDIQAWLFERKAFKIISKLDDKAIFFMDKFVDYVSANKNLEYIHNAAYFMVKYNHIKEKDLKYLLPIDTYVDGLIEKYPFAKLDYPDKKLVCEQDCSIDDAVNKAIETTEKYSEPDKVNDTIYTENHTN